MTIDETAQLHEELGFLQTVLNTHGLLYFAWEIPAIIVVCLAGVILIPFLTTLPRRMRTDMTIAGAVYLGGALGAEAIGGWHAEVAGFNNFAHSLIATAEEGLEMCGVIMRHWLARFIRHRGRRRRPLFADRKNPSVLVPANSRCRRSVRAALIAREVVSLAIMRRTRPAPDSSCNSPHHVAGDQRQWDR